MTEDSAQVVRIERTFDSPAEDVFDAWTSEEVIRRWFIPAQGWQEPSAQVDLRVGGTVRVVMRDPSGDPVRAGGEYTEIDRPHRLAFTWTFDDDPSNQQLIELEFEESGGVTTVRFTHRDLWSEEAVRSHEDGWGKAFDNLARTLERS